MQSALDLLDKLNTHDECRTIEAKSGSRISDAILETLCAFSNEPDIGEGYILLGVERDDDATLFSGSAATRYKVVGVSDSDKLQMDLASVCSNDTKFNQVIRPIIEPEEIEGKIVLKIRVPELPLSAKPLFFKKEGLPKGAFRRIGSTDQRCNEDDLYLFYKDPESFDRKIVRSADLDDLDEDAISYYRKLRKAKDSHAEELTYSNQDLLHSLGAVEKENGSYVPTNTGIAVFGKKAALRRLMPMLRVDYIRVPGNEWVSDPENRFDSHIDMRGSCIMLLQRAYSAVADDLPKGFILEEGQLQASSTGLPNRVLREALVNALIHRSYRENQPIQIIRYGNRIEIINPGFSLKPEEKLGEPGSKHRNPSIAAIFFDTGLAETKGTGIKTMRRLMENAQMAAPTFESDHSGNQFTIRLLLHHFLNEDDIRWLAVFENYHLSDAQKTALIFVRETGAIDLRAFRQLTVIEASLASHQLRNLRDHGLLELKGKTRGAYYKPTQHLLSTVPALSAPVPALSAPVPALSAPVPALSAPVPALSAPVPAHSAPVPAHSVLFSELHLKIKIQLSQILPREHDSDKIKEIIVEICKTRPYSLNELSILLGRQTKYILRAYLSPLIKENRIRHTFPDMPNHPGQAYTSEEKAEN